MPNALGGVDARNAALNSMCGGALSKHNGDVYDVVIVDGMTMRDGGWGEELSPDIIGRGKGVEAG